MSDFLYWLGAIMMAISGVGMIALLIVGIGSSFIDWIGERK